MPSLRRSSTAEYCMQLALSALQVLISADEAGLEVSHVMEPALKILPSGDFLHANIADRQSI